jgi:tripartite-type tricarboxylate transporter receptor subunit TctC
VTALAGKHLDFTICLATSAMPLTKAGKLRPLAVFGDKRDPYLPDVPIPKELGFDMTSIPGVRGVEAPPRTPASIVKVLEEAYGKAIKEPAFIEVAKNRQIVLHPLSSREYGQLVEATYPKVEKFQGMLKEK